ncbi:hypothetical protein [Cernens ardua]|uniref:hypothetical protein n=1 Tax=Cernens ardua TaxID=3402176 RepID=UPI003F9A887C
MTEANNVPQLNTEDESQPVDNQASVEAPHDPDEAKIDSFITKFKAGIKIVENVTDEAIEDVAEFVKKYV